MSGTSRGIGGATDSADHARTLPPEGERVTGRAGPARGSDLCDRDRKWSGAVRHLLREAGVRVVMTPERAPNANAHAERFVRSIKEECLDRMIPIGERHFRRAIVEFVEHYHHERNHQGLDNRLITNVPTPNSLPSPHISDLSTDSTPQ